MKETLTIYKTFLIGYVVLCVFIVGCDTKGQREPPDDSPVVQSVRPTDTERTDKLSEATRIKKWLKEQNYSVQPLGSGFTIRSSDGIGSISVSGNNNVAVSGKIKAEGMFGPGKFRLSIKGVGSAVFRFDTDGELQPAK